MFCARAFWLVTMVEKWVGKEKLEEKNEQPKGLSGDVEGPERPLLALKACLGYAHGSSVSTQGCLFLAQVKAAAVQV